MVTVSRPIKCPSKEKDVQAAAFFSPKDRFATADIDADGREELLAAYSKYSNQFPARPFVINDLWAGTTKFTMDNIFADNVVAGDMDADGKVEVIVAENVLEKSGWTVWHSAHPTTVSTAFINPPDTRLDSSSFAIASLGDTEACKLFFQSATIPGVTIL
jgi:hypothetical protein